MACALLPPTMKFLRPLSLVLAALSLALPALAAPKKLLVVSITTGFRHSSIETGEKVLGELARGGMGIVYRVQQLEPARTVALKMLLPHQVTSPGMVERFRLEARAIVIGHTVSANGRIATRFGGRVVQIDTGMLAGAFYPGGRASALEIHEGRFVAIYEDGREQLPITLTTKNEAASPAR